MPSFFLYPHPSANCGAVRSLQAQAHRGQEGLFLRYTLAGEIDALHIPPVDAPRHADGLWQDTCFEVFIKSAGPQAGYYEFNFAPSTAWACYRFDAYRHGMEAVDAAPAITLSRQADQIRLDAFIRRDDLPLLADAGLLLGLSAVIKGNNGQISYWAAAHPPGKPDFHHPDSFVCAIGPTAKT